MDKLKLYINGLMNNRIDEYTPNSSEFINIKKGGSSDIKENLPTGGFPPIFILKKEEMTTKNNKKLELINSKNKNNLNIGDIINKKYKIKAFI